MMKKGRLFLVGFIFLFLILGFSFSVKTAYAEDVIPEVVPGMNTANIEKIGGIVQNLSDDEARKQYLSQEWGKILEKNPVYIKYLKPSVDFYNKNLKPFLDPIFQYTIGVTPSFSWLFILTLVLWIAFVVYALRILDLASIFSRWLQYLISFSTVIIMSISGVTRTIAQYIIKSISVLTSWWMQLIVASLVVVAIILASIFSKELEKFFKDLKEKRKKMKEELEREQSRSAGRVVGAYADVLKRIK